MPKSRKRRPSGQPTLARQDGSLCATFVNTVCEQRKSLETYADLLVWGQQNAGLGAADAQRLARAAEACPSDAEAVAATARDRRDLLERILRALVEDRRPAADDLETLNAALGAVLANRRLVPAGSAYRWDFGDRGGDDLDRVLWPVLLDAGRILASKYHRKVRECAGEGCCLLFVDRTPGSPRKWCSDACGHRRRSNKHYHTTVKPYRREIEAMVAAEEARRRVVVRQEREQREAEAAAGEVADPGALTKRVC